MVRGDVAGAKIARVQTWLADAEPTLSLPVEQFIASAERRDLAIFYLFLAIQEYIDLAAHWVADAGWPAADDAGSTFDLLADHHVIAPELAATLRGAVGLRNRIAHGYALLDYRRVHKEAQEGMAGVRAFLSAVADAAGI